MSGPSHFDPVNTPGYLGRTLADVEIPGVRFAVVGSEDGLAITYSRGTDAATADSVAAAAAALRSLIKAMAQLCAGVPAGVRQSISEYDGGLIFIDTAGPGLLLAVAATREVDVALLAGRLTQIASRGHGLTDDASAPMRRTSTGRMITVCPETELTPFSPHPTRVQLLAHPKPILS